MKDIFRLSIRKLVMEPVPIGYPMYGIPQSQRYSVRTRVNGRVRTAGVSSRPDLDEKNFDKLVTEAQEVHEMACRDIVTLAKR